MTVLFVSGTGTGVGKTVVTAAIAALAAADGKQVALVKPVQTGLAPGQQSDLDIASCLSGVTDLHELARYPEPLAPATAARRLGLSSATSAALHDLVEDLAGRRDLVLVEGAGGLLVRLDGLKATIADVAAKLGCDVLIVTSAGLGALNAVALTAEALRARDGACSGLVIGSWPGSPDLASWCNVGDMEDYAGAPLLGALPEQAAGLTPAEFQRVARQSLAPQLGGVWDVAAFRETAGRAAG